MLIHLLAKWRMTLLAQVNMRIPDAGDLPELSQRGD
jgi:hypothetical protein